jgi:predicted RNA binding protein YcfA (HicA-like mRNA interferase family)
LKRDGFEYAPKRGKGIHTALYKIEDKGRKLLVIVPKRKELPTGTLVSILRQAELSRDNFIALLK